MEDNKQLLKLLAESKISQEEFDKRLKKIDKNINYFRGYMEACCDINKIL